MIVKSISRRRQSDDEKIIDDDEKNKKNSTDATTYLVGYDFGNTSPFARVSRPKKQKRIVSTSGVASKALSAAVSAATGNGDSFDSRNSRAVGGSATWFGRGNHVRLEGEADLFGGRAVGWGTYTLNDEADQVNSTAINLVERERGFVISPFTAATAVAAAGVEAEFSGGGASSSSSSSGGGKWKGALAFDFNKYAPYLAVARETSRAPRWLRRLAPPATSGKGLVGGVGQSRARGDLEDDGEDEEYDDDGGSARIAAHLSPADRVAMLTLELGGGGGGKGGSRNDGSGGSGLGGVLVGGGNALSSPPSSPASATTAASPAPLKAFVRARTDGKGFARGQGLRGVLSGLSGGIIFNHTVEI